MRYQLIVHQENSLELLSFFNEKKGTVLSFSLLNVWIVSFKTSEKFPELTFKKRKKNRVVEFLSCSVI